MPRSFQSSQSFSTFRSDPSSRGTLTHPCHFPHRASTCRTSPRQRPPHPRNLPLGCLRHGRKPPGCQCLSPREARIPEHPQALIPARCRRVRRQENSLQRALHQHRLPLQRHLGQLDLICFSVKMPMCFIKSGGSRLAADMLIGPGTQTVFLA